MADIPLNIDTPSGTEFTVNKTIRVDKASRVHFHVRNSDVKVRTRSGEVHIGLLSAAVDGVVSLETQAARLLAYEILKLTDLREQEKA